MDDSDLAPTLPHDEFEEVLPDVFLLRGSIEFAPGMRISRNMVVLRDGGELTLIGPVRTSPRGEEHLESLGRVARVLRLCNSHGLDDAWAKQRFGAELWCARATELAYPEPGADVRFDVGSDLPIGDLHLHRFDGLISTEIALRLDRHGGLLVTADAFQHYDDWRHFSLRGRFMARLMGIRSGTIVGPVWHRFFTEDEAALRASFDALLAQPFAHAVALHGTFVRDVAHARTVAAVEREFAKPGMPDWIYRRRRAEATERLEMLRAYTLAEPPC